MEASKTPKQCERELGTLLSDEDIRGKTVQCINVICEAFEQVDIPGGPALIACFCMISSICKELEIDKESAVELLHLMWGISDLANLVNIMREKVGEIMH